MKETLKTVAFFSILVTVIAGCGSGEEQSKQAEAPIKVITKQIIPTGQPEVFSYSGTIEADNTVSLGFSVSGRVTSVNVQEGQHVNAGQLLATIETIEYQNAVRLAQAGLDQAADNFKRLNELHTKGSLPERDFITTKVSLTQAEVNKSTALKRLSDTRLYAPFAGIVSAKSVEKGATAAPGVSAFTLLKTNQVYAQASVAESEISKLTIGKNAIISIPVLSESLEGKITIINPQADAASKTFNVKIRIGNASGKLLPGMMSDIKISTGKTVDAIAIPAEAVVRDADDITYVFVVNDDHKAIRKRVATGGLLINEVVITNGLQAGDKVIIAGQNKLKDGQAVSL
ncbi:efflux RND transporter periplasmic adaptor subunit [Mucilaginibacter dorajii]|uniref:Efflux RND transporter periplasmic adaptor subunit n=1 Tax=Mucilaginibacter dorajii TaxID=692994 RepID=A0ABP7QZT1_9SPHI|nr:efflux RND transporter periplasmic adaptor subunit [Mucilaginibacter dorajii]MCS3732292.1 RND family efflux transporter MFP subunit [Mucilaginibacter dorajii]